MSSQPKSNKSEAQSGQAAAPAGAETCFLLNVRGRRIAAPRRRNGTAGALDMPRIVGHYECVARAMRRQALADLVRFAAAMIQRPAASILATFRAPVRTALHKVRHA